MRSRLADHLRKVRCRDGGPTTECCLLFWATFAGWVGSLTLTYLSGSFLAALCWVTLTLTLTLSLPLPRPLPLPLTRTLTLTLTLTLTQVDSHPYPYPYPYPYP